MTLAAAIFGGFSKAGIQFLANLAEHNDRAWFQPRRADFERLLKEPLADLCVALDATFRERGIPLAADPARSPFRIYRDLRFSRDKSPYKTQVAASFPWAEDGVWPSRDDHHGNPGGYFHLAPGDVFVGGGLWRPERTTLGAFRAAVVRDPATIRAILDEPEFRRRFGGLGGDKLQRVPSGFPADHPEVELLKHKDLTYGQRLADSDVQSPALPDLIADAFETAVPLMRYLASL